MAGFISSRLEFLERPESPRAVGSLPERMESRQPGCPTARVWNEPGLVGTLTLTRSGSHPASIAVRLEIEAGPGVNPMRYPIDLVTDKHELISYDLGEAESWQQLEVEHNGR